MRVNTTGNNPIQGTDVSSAKQANRAGGVNTTKKSDAAQGTTQAESDGASANISSRGREMAQAKAIVDGTPDVREEKIAELKRRIAAGAYNVDANKIADKMVDEHLKMSGLG